VNRPPEPAPPSEPRQRWRITFARDPVAADAVGRTLLEAWQEAVAASGLPVARQVESSGRIRIAFAAPLPAAARGEREWADLWLVERLPAWHVRETLEPRLPDAHAWVDAEDVWLGAPALAGHVALADWRIEVEPVDAPALDALTKAALVLASARTIPRVRTKGTEQKAYDLRPLLAEMAVHASGDRVVILARTRFHPELGSGRPEEVVGALADASGVPLVIAAMTRSRLLLAEGPGGGRHR
jgi:hypothetical protein